MKEYHKIDSIYKRDLNGMFIDEFSRPEFGYLFENKWAGTEKIDGTNIRIMWEGKKLRIGGKTDNAQIPTSLYEKLTSMFSAEKMELVFPDTDICLYGEGYGARIQKGGGNYISAGVSFILFDVKIGFMWLKREDVIDIAGKLDILCVPEVFRGTLTEAIEMVKNGFTSQWGNFPAEGLVLKPAIELQDRRGHRIITKVKTRDFKI
jgi:hypothetical protein